MDFQDIKAKIENELKAVKNPQELRDFSVKYLGKKGEIRALFTKLKAMPAGEKRELGAQVNRFAAGLEEKVKELEASFSLTAGEITLKEDRESLDFNPPKIGHLHPITETIDEMNKIFLSMGYSIVDGPEIEEDEYCFKRLNVPSDHPARAMQDTIYIKEPNIMLRTQVSSVEARTLAKFRPPLKVVTPGRVYRNEKANKSNHFIFHHYQGVVVFKQVSLKDLFSTLNIVFKKMYGSEVVVRYRNKYYPEVEPGVGPDMRCFQCGGKGCALCKGVGWIEMGGAGIIHPNVLKMAGIDPKAWMGFAFGLGLDRWVMAKYNITDIRTLLGGNLGYKYHEHEGNL
jgi:phenylalanyl-tRNA synthetase alpha chain